MKTGARLVAFFFLIGLFSCDPGKIRVETKDGVITMTPFVWKSRISDGVLGYGLYHGYVIDGRGVLCVSMRKSPDPKDYGESYLQLKDVNTGANIWTWDELYNKKLVRTLNRSIVTHEDKLILHDVWANYCINTKTGQTIWKNERNFGSASELTNIGSQYFITGLSARSKVQNIIDDSMFMGDFDTAKVEEIVKPLYNDQYKNSNGERTYIGSIYRHKAFVLGTEKMLLIPYSELGPQVKYNNNRSFFGLYNLSQKKWVYSRMPLSIEEDGATPCLMPIIEDGKVYLTSLNSVGCFDLMTGKRLWQYRMMDEYTGFGDFIKVGNKIILNGHDSYLYCVNADTGARQWAQVNAALSSDIYYQDGIIYGIRGDGLRAYYLETGKMIWDLTSPDGKAEGRSDSEYGGFVTGIPGSSGKKGRIFATTNLNLYCFEAVR